MNIKTTAPSRQHFATAAPKQGEQQQPEPTPPSYSEVFVSQAKKNLDENVGFYSAFAGAVAAQRLVPASAGLVPKLAVGLGGAVLGSKVGGFLVEGAGSLGSSKIGGKNGEHIGKAAGLALFTGLVAGPSVAAGGALGIGIISAFDTHIARKAS